MDWHLYQPYLDMFDSEPCAPNAIMLEYIPDAEMISEENITTQRIQNFLYGIKEIHKSLVRHDDVAPRNMLVVNGDPEKVVWIDFDRARTSNTLSDSEKEEMKIEVEIAADILEDRVSEQRSSPT